MCMSAYFILYCTVFCILVLTFRQGSNGLVAQIGENFDDQSNNRFYFDVAVICHKRVCKGLSL